MAIVLGLNAKLLRGAAGSQANIEVKNVKDLTLNLESGEADVTTRATGGWRASAATLKEASLEFGILELACKHHNLSVTVNKDIACNA